MKHLIVIQNGLNGFNYFMKKVQIYLEKYLDKEKFTIVVSDVNDFHKTWTGIDKCGQRLADFIRLQCANNSYDCISMIGHSMGGLMLRHSIGILEMDGFFFKIKPIYYISVATPHLGVENAVSYKKHLANWLLGQTGQQLLLSDDEGLLLHMSDITSSNMMGLTRFTNRIAYGNWLGDDSVDVVSACLTDITEINKLDRPIKNQLFDILNQPPIDNKIKSSTICANLLTIPWTRKAIDLSDYYNVHVAIMNNGFTSNTKVLDDIASIFLGRVNN